MAFSKPLGTDAYNDQIVLRNLRGSYNHQESYTLILLDDAGKQLVPEVIATPEELTFGKKW
jgi:hypothetical protein